jgi:hypothetical protein
MIVTILRKNIELIVDTSKGLIVEKDDRMRDLGFGRKMSMKT